MPRSSKPKRNPILRPSLLLYFSLLLAAFYCLFFGLPFSSSDDPFNVDFPAPPVTEELEKIPLVSARLEINIGTEEERKCNQVSIRFSAAQTNLSGNTIQPFTNPECVHVVIAADGTYIAPLLAAVNSIEKNTGASRTIFYHLLTSAGESVGVHDALSKLIKDLNSTSPVEIVEFNGKRVEPLIRVWEGKNSQVYYNTFNYARFYLPDLFPKVHGPLVYVDPDTIINSDLGDLYRLFIEDRSISERRQRFLAAVPSKPTDSRYTHHCFLVNCDDDAVRAVVKKPELKYFNAGVFITDIDLWREFKVTSQLEHWLRTNTQRRIWRWGSQGPLVLVFYDRWMTLPKEWNERNARKPEVVKSKSGSKVVKEEVAAKIYHFTSGIKPWKSNGGPILWRIWCPYYPDRKNLWFCGNGDAPEIGLRPTSPLDYAFVKRIWNEL